MKKVAIFIDGGFASKVFLDQLKRHITADDIVKLMNKLIDGAKEELLRTYYYDAPPYDGKITNPINKQIIDCSTTPVFSAINKFHRELAEKNFLALRKGKLSFKGWKLTDLGASKVSNNQLLIPSDIKPDFEQKTVDMKIGLDIAWIATKRIVDKIVLVTADNDFIPAMKFARKEGLHVAVAKIENLNSDMHQHADEVFPIDIKKI